MLMTDLSRERFGRPPLVTPNSFASPGFFCFLDNSMGFPAERVKGRGCSRD
jgi:hypothetical protein